MKKGDNVFIIENNRQIKPVQVIKCVGDSCLIRIGEYSGFWINKSRLYHSVSEAESKITYAKVKTEEKEINPGAGEIYLKNNAVWNGL